MWSEESDDLDRRLLTLVRSSHCGVIEDAYNQIKLIKKTNSSSHYYLLNISNLKDGTYDLYLRGQRSHHITIKVHKGEYLKNMDNIILKQNCIQELATSQKIVKIKES